MLTKTITARCGDELCSHVWIVAHLPMSIDKVALLMKRAACPKCGNDSAVLAHG
ncbi:hypothetical protein [Sphingobium xenophagum]|uniref:hypothetical protein n=1 Tax=Sphingobium xenophagum TaxID=121428 RepID=UPI00039F9040|nr:hypothetical protein [Sphingobium xenophagum]